MSVNRQFLCGLCWPLFPDHDCYKWGEPFKLRAELNKVCKITDSIAIDMFRPLLGKKELFFKDGIHPNSRGYMKIAEITKEKILPYITGDFGGLQMPYVFSDNMVIQRNKTVSVWGKANKDQNIFLSEESLLKKQLLFKVAAGNSYWFDRQYIPSWPRQRAKQNLSDWLKSSKAIIPTHPFEPSSLFKAAVSPISKLSFTGVIWYQGESNATQADNRTATDQLYTKATLKTYKRLASTL